MRITLKGRLALCVASEGQRIRTASSRLLSDIVEIAGSDVIPLFRPDGARLERISIRRIRAQGETEWQWIDDPREARAFRRPRPHD
jgi:hypothetical protein